MNLGALLARLNRLQHSRGFKVAASVLVVALAIAGVATYTVVKTAPAGPAESAAAVAMPSEATPQDARERERLEFERSTSAAIERLIGDVTRARTDPVNVGIAAAIASGVALVVIWLGLGLTYLGLGLAAGVIAWPLRLVGMPGLSTLLLFSIALTAALTALMQALRLGLGGSTPVLAIARNVVIESVRMKISLVFIVLLVFAVAGLPLLLDTQTPLRYRVQSFLQYGTGGSFWIVALLTVTFSVASVSFEQRDRQIWQTMTKPVASWQYIFGKWLGVVALNAVLLTVCLAGVYMFTEYLRRQPAEGEAVRQLAVSAQGRAPVSPDRLTLETQVLSARQTREPVLPAGRESEEFRSAVRAYVEQTRLVDPDYGTRPGELESITEQLWTQARDLQRTIGPGQVRTFRFEGLEEARRQGLPLILRYKLNAGGNIPGDQYGVTFIFQGVNVWSGRTLLGTAQTVTIPLAHMIGEDGIGVLEVLNGVYIENPERRGEIAVLGNPESITFSPEEGLELSYRAGGWTMNLARVGVVLWLKLAFLAMLGICLATFLSFPVACLVAMTLFVAAEATSFLTASLEMYVTEDVQTGETQWWRVPIRLIALAITWVFGTYGELNPTQRLVDGKLMPWSTVWYGMVVLAAWCLALLGAAVAVFRRRELATYSGQ